MYTIDRLIAIIKPRQPFMDWLESMPGWDLDLTLDDLRKDCLTLLIPEYDDNEKAMRYIERNCKSIFEMRLFRKWFDVEIHSMIYDMAERGIVRYLC